MKCDKCGNTLQDGATFCNMCGAGVTASATPTTTQPNSGKSVDPKIIVIIILVIGLIVTGVLLIMSYNKGTKDCPKCEDNCGTAALENNTIPTTEEQTTDKINYGREYDYKDFKVTAEDNNSKSKNIKFIKGTYNKSDYSAYMDLLFENNNDEIYDGTVYLNYYKNGKRIDSSLTFTGYAKPHSKFVVSITPTMYEEFDSFDITYKTSMKSSGTKDSPVDNSKIRHEKIHSSTRDEISVRYVNDTKETVNYMFMILYKKNGEIVGFKNGYAGDVRPGDTAAHDFSDYHAPKDGYDDYEVSIQAAYYTTDDDE